MGPQDAAVERFTTSPLESYRRIARRERLPPTIPSPQEVTPSHFLFCPRYSLPGGIIERVDDPGGGGGGGYRSGPSGFCRKYHLVQSYGLFEKRHIFLPHWQILSQAGSLPWPCLI